MSATNKLSWLWIPGSRLTARQGMTIVVRSVGAGSARDLRRINLFDRTN
jgi:hypothetical protein